ncbi:Similar to PPIF: Peptidyl-prolyl cis-trans isomerase F [Cotesia congregata]|uniref:Mitochondrial (Homo sapiens) n=1 Tax=Cotesia congregata TaxID=51543 RepID=A0A8J2MNU5_COTCN|nr:Similar to PPIF: Peptidyl-prolyl cis-trans isomerase F [Cotesia congregata]
MYLRSCMLDPSVLTDLEELTLCGFCKQKYNDAELCPKYLSCKHYFCLRCIESNLMKGRELFCAHCWKRTDLGDQGPDALPTNSPLLALANNFTYLKITSNNTSCKQNDKERKSENCHTHGMPLTLWCSSCCILLCRACATPHEHPGHQIKTQTDAKEQLISDVQHELVTMGKLSSEIQRMAMQQREFLIKVLEACVTLKTHVETDLQNGWTHFPEISDARETLGKAKASLQVSDSPNDVYSLHSHLVMEKQRLQSKYQEMMLQCQLDDLIGNSGVIFDFGLLKQALASIHSGEPILLQPAGNGRVHNHISAAQNPILFLANYCMSQLYSRHVVSKQHMQNGTIDYHTNMIQTPAPPGSIHIHPVQLAPQGQPIAQTQLLIPPGSPSVKPIQTVPPNSILQPQPNAFMQDNGSSGSGVGSLSVHSPTSNSSITVTLRGPSANPYPMYYFNIEVNGSPHGRIVIEVRPDVAPKMAKNFSVLATGEIGVGYKGCSIFQCWEGESVITGDFELNNGRGGRSIYEDGYFMPDDTKFPAVRGAVGMRRTQKRHDNLGMVGSQFRIILQEMRGFTGIFGHVVEGLELVEKISTYGDQTGKPTKTIIITKCGKL